MIVAQAQVLNMQPGVQAPTVVHVSQGDVNNTLQFYLYNGSDIFEANGYSVAVHGIRSDGVGFGPYPMQTYPGSNMVSIDLYAAMTAVPGAALAEVTVSNGIAVVGSANFALLVEQATFPQGVTYTNDTSVYQSILDYVIAIPGALSNQINANVNAEATARATQDAVLQAEIDQFVALSQGSTTGDAELMNIRIGANGTTYSTAGDAVRGQVSDINGTTGTWYYTKAFSSTQYPYIILGATYTKLYIKILAPLTGYIGFTIAATNDNWSTQTQIYANASGATEDTVELDVTGYNNLRVIVSLSSSTSGTLRAIIHGYDDHSLSQEVVNIKADVADINDELKAQAIPAALLTGTNYNGYYINNWASKKIKSIANTAFNVKSYPVTADTTYYIKGYNVSLASDLPLVAFGTVAVANDAVYDEIIINGTQTATDYRQRYTPTQNGYIYVAWVSGRGELDVYSTVPVADAYAERFPVVPSVKVQVFGDSISDATWGDKRTWVSVLPDYLGGYDLTIINSAVGGSGLGHGHSDSGQYSSKEYNFVYDLVTDGTLDTTADLVVVFAGTNDWNNGVTLGELGDDTVSTEYGALALIIKYITEHTDAIVLLVTPPQRFASYESTRPTNALGEPIVNNVSLRTYCSAWLESGEFYGQPCVNLNSVLGWNRINVSNFTVDGLHPNNAGDDMIAKVIASVIKDHF